MKLKVIRYSFALGIILLFFGALTAKTVDQLLSEDQTVSSWTDLMELYLDARSGLPPLPSPVPYETVDTMMNQNDWSFLSEKYWSFPCSGGSVYVSDQSDLAALSLPMQVCVYEDLKNHEIIILGSTNGVTYTGLALFEAPDFLPEEQSFDKGPYLQAELSPRRVIWSITLESETDAETDLAAQTTAFSLSATSLSTGLMTLLSVPAEHTNDLWMSIDKSNPPEVRVFAPEDFTNRVEIYSCTNLVSGRWGVAIQNLYPSTNPAVWTVTSSGTCGFFRAGNMDIDSDFDGINDARERIVHRTDPNSSDSDGDTVSDYQELYVNFTDPNNGDISAPLVWITFPDPGIGKAMLP